MYILFLFLLFHRYSIYEMRWEQLNGFICNPKLKTKTLEENNYTFKSDLKSDIKSQHLLSFFELSTNTMDW